MNKKCIIFAHGSIMSRYFNIPEQIRLVESTVSSYVLADRVDILLKMLQTNPLVFRNVDSHKGLAITKKGMEIQRELRDINNTDLNYGKIFKGANSVEPSMRRLIGLKSGTRYKDRELSFSSFENSNSKGNVRIHHWGIYINHHDGWRIYYPFISDINGELSLELLSGEKYPIDINGKRIFKPDASIANKISPQRILLSEILEQLSIKAQEAGDIYEVYVESCHAGKSFGAAINTKAIKENNQLFFNEQRAATLAYNETLNEEKKSGVTMRNTRTFHYNADFFTPQKYFNLNYRDLPEKDKEELLPKLGVDNGHRWNELREDDEFKVMVILYHSKFLPSKIVHPNKAEVLERSLLELHLLMRRIKFICVTSPIILNKRYTNLSETSRNILVTDLNITNEEGWRILKNGGHTSLEEYKNKIEQIIELVNETNSIEVKTYQDFFITRYKRRLAFLFNKLLKERHNVTRTDGSRSEIMLTEIKNDPLELLNISKISSNDTFKLNELIRNCHQLVGTIHSPATLEEAISNFDVMIHRIKREPSLFPELVDETSIETYQDFFITRYKRRLAFLFNKLLKERDNVTRTDGSTSEIMPREIMNVPLDLLNISKISSNDTYKLNELIRNCVQLVETIQSPATLKKAISNFDEMIHRIKREPSLFPVILAPPVLLPPAADPAAAGPAPPVLSPPAASERKCKFCKNKLNNGNVNVCKKQFCIFKKRAASVPTHMRMRAGGKTAKKEPIKKLIAGKKRVIHIGPKGGKYYIRIRNGKKVKVYT